MWPARSTGRGNLVSGFVHSVETAGTVDGPGIRFVVFLSGCPLSCLYCHNPDARKKRHGLPRTSEEILDEIALYKNFLLRAGGGVTISGGEPLAQPLFTKELLKGAKALGLHTVIDTTGYLGTKADPELLEATDLVLLDIKSGIPETYKTVTGLELQPTLDFARMLDTMGKPIWLRFVLVPGLTDAPENISAVAKFAATLGNVRRVDILPFHKMGEYKWEELGLNYTLKDTPEPSPEDVDRAKAVFAQAGLKVAA